MLTLDDRHRLITAHLRYVVVIAARFRDRGVSMDDLVSEGNLGLVEAARRFDPSRGVRFTTYATYWIRRGILRAIASHHLAVHVPEGRRRLLRGLGEQEARPAGGLGRAPADDEVRRRMRLTLRELESLRGAGRGALSLSAPLGFESEATLADTLPAPPEHDPERALERRDAERRVRHALQALTGREREVIDRRFGIGAGAPATLRRIGADLGVSGEAVRVIEKRALWRLRAAVVRYARRRLEREARPGSAV